MTKIVGENFVNLEEHVETYVEEDRKTHQVASLVRKYEKIKEEENILARELKTEGSLERKKERNSLEDSETLKRSKSSISTSEFSLSGRLKKTSALGISPVRKISKQRENKLNFKPKTVKLLRENFEDRSASTDSDKLGIKMRLNFPPRILKNTLLPANKVRDTKTGQNISHERDCLVGGEVRNDDLRTNQD